MKMSEHQALFDAVEAEPEKKVDLTDIRKKASELWDRYREKTELEERIKNLSSRIKAIEQNELPEMFTQVGMSSITVEAMGNRPAFIAERGTVYTAKIPDDKRMEAFQWFESQGHGDLVKSVINIFFGMQEHERRLEVMALLDAHGIQYYPNESIHHQTLRAFVKREIKKNHILPRELLGVYVFDEVKIK